MSFQTSLSRLRHQQTHSLHILINTIVPSPVLTSVLTIESVPVHTANEPIDVPVHIDDTVSYTVDVPEHTDVTNTPNLILDDNTNNFIEH